MSLRLTAKQEAFIEAYIKSGNASAAYRLAYNTQAAPEGVHVRACELLKSSKVSVRIEELRRAMSEKVEVSLADIARMLQEDRDLARLKEDGGTAASIAMNLAKLLGHYAEKKHVTTDNRHHHSAEPVSESAEWVARQLGIGSEVEDQEPLSH